MKKLKSSRPRDRLSELPESLIFHIFWLLPMRDVVRTTILSKKWKNLWTTTPSLNFSFYEDMNMDIRQVRHFITRAVILWEGIRIQKFKIDFKPGSWVFTDYDFWVHFALRKKVQELSLRGPSHPHGYSVPQNVYSCSSLKELSLADCCLEINGNVQWNQLNSLRIDGASLSEHVINQILCGSPLLEVFILTHKECSENLSIRSSSLKRLSINREEIFGEPCLDRELRIWTPNLETLEIYGVPYCKCLLMDVSSLTHVTLGFNIDSHGRDFLGETLRQIFPTIQHVESLTLSVSCIKRETASFASEESESIFQCAAASDAE